MLCFNNISGAPVDFLISNIILTVFVSNSKFLWDNPFMRARCKPCKQFKTSALYCTVLQAPSLDILKNWMITKFEQLSQPKTVWCPRWRDLPTPGEIHTYWFLHWYKSSGHFCYTITSRLGSCCRFGPHGGHHCCITRVRTIVCTPWGSNSRPPHRPYS